MKQARMEEEGEGKIDDGWETDEGARINTTYTYWT